MLLEVSGTWHEREHLTKGYIVDKAFTTIKHETLTSEERERTKELRRIHIGEHAERSWPFESEVRARLAELPDVSVAVAADAAAMLREVMFWEIKAEHRDFWVYRVVKCKECDPDPEHNCCWHKMGLSKRNVHAARELLVEWGLLEYTNGKGLPSGYFNRTHYRVKQLAVMNFREKPPAQEIDTVVQVDGPNELTRWTERTNYTESIQSEPISLTQSIPAEPIGSREQNSRNKELHEGQHEKSPSATNPRESKFLSVGERIARQVHRRLKLKYGNPKQTRSLWPSSGLMPVEFSALVSDVNHLHEWFRKPFGEPLPPMTFEEISDAADWLVDCYMYSEDGRAYPPRADGPLIVTAYQATKFGNPPRKL